MNNRTVVSYITAFLLMVVSLLPAFAGSSGGSSGGGASSFAELTGTCAVSQGGTGNTTGAGLFGDTSATQTANVTLTASDASLQLIDLGSAASSVAITLPLASTCPGKIFYFYAYGSVGGRNVTIQRQGSDSIGGGNSFSTFSGNGRGFCGVISTGSLNTWVPISLGYNTATLAPNNGAFMQYAAGAGWYANSTLLTTNGGTGNTYGAGIFSDGTAHTFTGDETLTATSPSLNIAGSLSANTNITLPAANTCPGKSFFFYNSNSSKTININRAGSDIIIRFGTFSGTTTIALTSGAPSWAEVVSTGSLWVMSRPSIYSPGVCSPGAVATFNSNAALTGTGAGTSGQLLQSGGSGIPTWTSSPSISSATITPAAAPSSPASGWKLYSDSGDSNKLKIKSSDGTVVDLTAAATAGTQGDRVIQVGPSYIGSTTVSVTGIPGAAASAGLGGAAITGKRLTFPATTGATSGNLAYVGHNGSGSGDVTAFALEPSFSATVYIVDTADVRIWSGIASAAGGGFWGTDTPGATNAENGLMFRDSTAAGDTNWQAVSFDGSADTVRDTGIAITASHLYRLEITTASGGGSATFTVTDITAGTSGNVTISTHLPTGSANIKPMSIVETLTAAAKTANFGTIWVAD